MARTVKQKRSGRETIIPFTKENYILFVIGLVVLIVGFKALETGPWNSAMSLTVGPILLVLAYCVIFPVAILYHHRRKNNAS